MSPDDMTGLIIVLLALVVDMGTPIMKGGTTNDPRHRPAASMPRPELERLSGARIDKGDSLQRLPGDL